MLYNETHVIAHPLLMTPAPLPAGQGHIMPMKKEV